VVLCTVVGGVPAGVDALEWTALAQRKAEHGPTVPPPAPDLLPKLPGRQHDAVIAAASPPDRLLPSRDDHTCPAAWAWASGTLGRRPQEARLDSVMRSM